MTRLFLLLTLIALLGWPAEAQARFGAPKKSQKEVLLETTTDLNAETQAMVETKTAACDAGDADACLQVADTYRRGFGVSQNYARAAKYYEAGCTEGSGASCSGYAYLLNRGSGIARDLEKARMVYERACVLGDTTGCAGLGNLLYSGTGGAPDKRRGGQLLKDACETGDEWACDRVIALGVPDRDPKRRDRWRGE